MLSLCSCARRSTSRIFLIDTLFVGIGCPTLFLLTEVADQLIRVSTGAMPARLSPAVRDHRNDCPEIHWIECPQVALNLHTWRTKDSLHPKNELKFRGGTALQPPKASRVC